MIKTVEMNTDNGETSVFNSGKAPEQTAAWDAPIWCSVEKEDPYDVAHAKDVRFKSEMLIGRRCR